MKHKSSSNKIPRHTRSNHIFCHDLGIRSASMRKPRALVQIYLVLVIAQFATISRSIVTGISRHGGSPFTSNRRVFLRTFLALYKGISRDGLSTLKCHIRSVLHDGYHTGTFFLFPNFLLTSFRTPTLSCLYIQVFFPGSVCPSRLENFLSYYLPSLLLFYFSIEFP